MTIQGLQREFFDDLIVGSEKKKEQKHLNIDDMRSIHLKPCHVQFKEHCGLKFGGR